MSASRVRAGQVFVEIGADPRKFFATLGRLNKAMGSIGRNVANAGAGLAGIGAGMAAPLVASVAQGTKFENVLLGIRASTGATQEQLDRIKTSSMAMSQALGVGPTEAAAGMLELLKAGMSLDGVLSGAGEAALQFAKVGNMQVSDAAVVMADAMNVFKVSGEVAANTLSSAADSSSTSIELIAQSFSQVSAVAGLANQSIQDTAAAIAVLANAGIKGSDAGTSLKTMLMRLMAPTDESEKAIAQLGLTVQSFRNADGKIKPLVDVIGTLNKAMAGMDQATQDDVFRRVFGQDAIRAAAVLTQAGVQGFGAMRQGMDGALSVGEKYAALQSGLSGSTARLLAGLDRLAVTISDAIAPSFKQFSDSLLGVVNWLTSLASLNPSVVSAFTNVAYSVSAAGIAFIGLGTALQGVSFAFGGFLSASRAITVPFSLAVSLSSALGKSVAGVTTQMVALATSGAAAASKLAVTLGSQLLSSATQAGAMMVRLGTQSVAALASIGTAAASMGAITFASFAKSLAGVTAYAAASIGSAVATTAAWAAANVPLLALVGVIGGSIVVFTQLTSLASTLGSVITDSVGTAVSESIVVFNDLKRVGMTAFAAVSDALAAGDMALAMETAMAGVLAAFTRGANALLSKTQGLSADIQNTLDAFATFAKNPTLGFMAATGTDPELLNRDPQMVALRERQAARLAKVQVDDGVRAAKSAKAEGKVNELAAIAAAKRADADTARQAGDRLSSAKTMHDVNLARQMIGGLMDSGNLTAEAEQRLVDDFQAKFAEMNVLPMASGAPQNAAAAAFNPDANNVLAQIVGASSMKQLGKAGSKLNDLIAGDTLSADQEQMLVEHFRNQHEQLARANAEMASADAQRSKAEVAGTFSAQAAMGMGFGSSLAERTAKAAEATAKGVGQLVEQGGGRVAA